MTRRQKAYFAWRGGSAAVFLGSATLLPHGVPAAALCIAGGIGGVLTCVGVNAGGPGEQAGARRDSVRYERVRAPQGDWPPYDPSKVIEGELAG